MADSIHGLLQPQEIAEESDDIPATNGINLVGGRYGAIAFVEEEANAVQSV